MDAKRTVAFWRLLYYFLVKSKNTNVPADASAGIVGRYVAPITYAPYNFAFASANDFTGFNETAFWRSIADWDARCPELELDGFRSIFEYDLVDS